ncbi:MAG: hypothetical protein KKF68_02355 [Nanoarchaeota archaeon]|nr:hypothetical protein [Nanoarchaeota archaeon]
MAENDERNLYQLKQDYKKIEKKYSLPIFEQLNEDFHIEKLAELETEFLIREIRKFMAERIGSYLRFVETLLQPGNSPMFIFSIVKLLDSVDKDRLTKIYKKLAKIEVDIFEIDISFSEEKEANFIKNSYKIWQEIKEDFSQVVGSIKKNWGNKFQADSKGYFG